MRLGTMRSFLLTYVYCSMGGVAPTALADGAHASNAQNRLSTNKLPVAKKVELA